MTATCRPIVIDRRGRLGRLQAIDDMHAAAARPHRQRLQPIVNAGHTQSHGHVVTVDRSMNHTRSHVTQHSFINNDAVTMTIERSRFVITAH